MRAVAAMILAGSAVGLPLPDKVQCFGTPGNYCAPITCCKEFDTVSGLCTKNDCEKPQISCQHGYELIGTCSPLFTNPPIGICCHKNTTEVAKSEEMVQGGTLKLVWKDCGDSTFHAKVTSLAPDSIKLGTTTHVNGSGQLDEQVSGGGFTINAKFGPVTENWSGEVCTSKSFKLPLGIGKVTWDGIKCPAAKGPVSVGVDVQLSGLIPAAAASGTIDIKGTDSAGANLLCLHLDVSKENTAVQEVNDAKLDHIVV